MTARQGRSVASRPHREASAGRRGPARAAAAPSRCDATGRHASRVERLGMVAAGDLGEQRRCPVELPRLGQELDEAEPAARLQDRCRHHPLHELGRASECSRAGDRHDRRAVVGEARLELDRLEEVQEELGVLRPLRRRPASHVIVAVLAEQDAELAFGPASLGRVEG